MKKSWLEELNYEIQEQFNSVARSMRTREFWIYFAIIFLLSLLAIGCAYLAVGFDSLSRSQLQMALSCKTGDGQIGTIIVGSFVFVITCVFTLGEVTYWVEENRQARSSGRPSRAGYIRPLLHVIGTVILGLGGFLLMSAWCF